MTLVLFSNSASLDKTATGNFTLDKERRHFKDIESQRIRLVTMKDK